MMDKEKGSDGVKATDTAKDDFNARLTSLSTKKKTKKRKWSGLKLTSKLGLIGIIGLMVLVGYVVIGNFSSSSVEDSRDTRLDGYEVTKMQVMRDVESYLVASTEEEFISSKRDVRFTSELKNDLYGKEFNYTKVQGYSTVNFLDVQYSFEYDGVFKVYLLTSLERNTESKMVTFVVSVRDGKAFDMIAF